MTTIQIQVNSGNDDACKRYKATTSYIYNSSIVTVGNQLTTGYGWSAGFIFRGIPIRQGATINSASLEVHAQASGGNKAKAKIRAYDADDYSGDFNTEAEWDAIFPGSLTTASVNWDNPAAWTSGTWYTSPDIKTVIQEIIDRPGWSKNNDMVIFLDDYDERSASDSFRNIYCIENLPSSGAKLNISYVADAQIIGPMIF